ncbi:MAG: hypothetical protein IPH36_16900 [Saprospiraceae bacterium]|nr:hypothetical protein [Saprospiraceae bacterium]
MLRIGWNQPITLRCAGGRLRIAVITQADITVRIQLISPQDLEQNRK